MDRAAVSVLDVEGTADNAADFAESEGFPIWGSHNMPFYRLRDLDRHAIL
jgi:hypothetical protein